MDDELKFEALKRSAVDWNEQQFGREARKKYGDAEVDSAHEAVMGLTKEQYAEWKRLGDEIRSRLETAVNAKSRRGQRRSPRDSPRCTAAGWASRALNTTRRATAAWPPYTHPTSASPRTTTATYRAAPPSSPLPSSAGRDGAKKDKAGELCSPALLRMMQTACYSLV